MQNKKHAMEINYDGITYNGIPFKNWSQKMQEDFIEGFVTNTLGNNNKYSYSDSSSSYSSNSNNNSSNGTGHWTDKFNIGNPDTDKGHWVTLDNGKHIFIKDTKGGSRGSNNNNNNSSNNYSSTRKTKGASTGFASSVPNNKTDEHVQLEGHIQLNNYDNDNSNNSDKNIVPVQNKQQENKQEIKLQSKPQAKTSMPVSNTKKDNEIKGVPANSTAAPQKVIIKDNRLKEEENSVEKAIVGALNTYKRQSDLQEQDMRKITKELENKTKSVLINSGIKIFNNSNNEQKQMLLELGIGAMYSNKLIDLHKYAKDYSGLDTAGMLDLAHGEDKMNDKNYIKDVIKIKNCNDTILSSDIDYWNKKVKEQFERDGYNKDNIPGYFFKSNSAPSKRLSESQDLKNILKEHKKEILNGSEFSGQFPQYGNDLISKMSKENNFKNAYGKVDFRHPYIDKQGNLHIVMYDTYDFNNEDSILIQAGKNQMKKGNLKPFFTMHAIIIPKSEADKILK